MKRILFVALAFLSIGLGILGIFIPLLPTTPFLLLAAWLLAKSSGRLLEKLLRNRFAGKYIRNYREGKGIPVRVKISAIIFLWTGILISAFCFEFGWHIRIPLILLATGVSIHILRIRQRRN